MNVVITIMGCTYSLGQVVLGGLAFALRDWRTLSLTLSIPFFAVFLICWLVKGGAFSLGANISGREGPPPPTPLAGHRPRDAKSSAKQ